jgi:hypothetical protein
VRPAVEAEKLGIASVVIATSGFTTLARVLSKSSGIDNLRIAEYPGPMGIDTSAQIKEKLESRVFDAVVKGLTLSEPKQRAAAAPQSRNPADIVFTGSLYEVNEYFTHQEWTDGLPVFAPTLERVEEFLSYCERAPDEEIAILPASNLRAVPLNIAANAIMAGCRPEHMPLIIAAVEALADEKCNLYNVGSTSGLVPFLVVNGPIVRDLGLEFGGQLISRGPNPAIGRAVGLIVKNIAGFRPGKNYMGTFGYPLVFTLAEDESTTPWVPFHVEQGFDRNQSTVTIGVTNNWGPTSEPSATVDMTAADVALELLCREIPKKFRLYDFPTIGPKAETVMVTLVISPPIAKLLAQAGYSKQDIREHVYEHARMPLREFTWITEHTFPRGMTVRQKAEAGVLPKEYLGTPDDMVRILKGPEIVHIVVCGDPNRNRLMSFEGGHTIPTTKEVRLPRDWKARLCRKEQKLEEIA